MRPQAGCTAIEIAIEASLEGLHGRRVGLVPKRGIRKPELPGARRE